MNVKKLKAAISSFEEELDGALLACDIWDKATGLSYAGYNSNERYTALFGRLNINMEKALGDLGFPPFGEYQLIDLDVDAMLLIMHFDNKYLWGSLLDKNKVTLGLLLSVIMPNARKEFMKAINE